MRPIDADALYKKACDLEAQALDYIAKISSKTENWIMWNAILAERLAFKYDVYDAPTIEPERKTGIWKNRSLNILYPEWERYECSVCGGYSYIHKYCPNCGARMEGDTE